MSAALPKWPEYVLPAPSLSDDLSMEYPQLVTRTDFDQGAARQRSNWASGATTQWITWPMTATQLRIFHGFWRNEISNGADWFKLKIFNDDDYRTFKVRFVPGTGAQNTGNIGRNAGEWMYAAQVETLDETSPDPDETGEMALVYGQTLALDEIVGLLDAAVQQLGAAL